MTQYFLSTEQSNQQYVQFRVQFSNVTENATIVLPRWRPGRYELGNFAKNVRNFRVFDGHGKPCVVQKTDTSTWQVFNENGADLRVEYGYYAADLNAGSTYLPNNRIGSGII
ncbi:MAG: M61 family peptidase, partial [Flavobacteriia bacterium]|nr:M61 family peptidase [Flavobacteriia bacterium]